MRYVFISLVLFCFLGMYPQSLKTNYKPLESYYPSKDYMKRVVSGYDSIYHAIDFERRNEGRNFRNAMEVQKKFITSLSDDSILMYNDAMTNYVQRIAQRIKSKNPLLKDQKFRVFTYRTTIPNAATYGNGIILFNLGMLAALKSEANVAFVLCHEISHDLKGHVVDNIISRYRLENDPAIKKQYDDLKKQEYNKYKSYEAFIATIVQKRTSRSREHEVQADSMGLVLYLNAGYNIQQAYETTERLDSIDNRQYLDKISLAQYFNSDAQPFKRSWLEKEEEEETIGGGNYVKPKFPDSLKTHPDCQYRLKKLQDLHLSNMTIVPDIGKFDSIRAMAEYEMLRVYIDDLTIGEGFYNCLQLYARNLSNLYLKASVVEYMYDIYALKKNHYFSLTAPKPDPIYNGAYNELLCFVHNISPDECKIATTQFFMANFATTISDPYVAYVYSLVKAIDKTAEQRKALVDLYAGEFGKNSYYRLLAQRLLKKTT